MLCRYGGAILLSGGVNEMKRVALIIPLLLALSYMNSVRATTVLIDPSTRNGSFESGTATPWGGVSVTDNPAFAHSGVYYGSVAGIRADVFQFIPISNTNGHEFSLSLWARVPDTDGFGSLSVSMSDSGFTKTAAVVPLVVPTLSAEEWRLFSFAFSTPTNWNDSGDTKLSIAFPNSSGTRYAYVDSITLAQVPEPSTTVLLCFGLLGIAALWRAR